MAHESTSSLWLANAPAATFPRLDGDRTVDVAIVGGGISGLTAALLLARAGRKIAVLEAGQIGHGVSGRTTAHLTTFVDARYQDLLKDFSQSDAELVAESSPAAICSIAAVVRTEQIDCDFKRVDGYFYSESADDEDVVRAELKAALKAGIDAAWTDDVPLPFAVHGGARVPNQAQFHPARYLLGLARAVQQAGGLVCEFSPVDDIDGGTPCRAVGERGTVTAAAVIIATHMPINDMYLVAKAQAYRSYVLGARLEGAVPEGLFWDTASPYHYARGASDRSGPLLVVGGEDHQTGREEDAAGRFDRLERYVRERYAVREIAYRWSAQFYEPVDGLPFIGEYPLRPNVYAATGYSGNGMTFGTLAAMILSDQVLGEPNPYSDLYSINRLKLAAGGPEMIKAGLGEALRFVADRFKGDDDPAGSLAPGEGRLLEIDGGQVAAYRDDHGVLHTLSPVCSHLGCIVQWNNAERSWDCPCHGGRYTATGVVLEGPPTKDLEMK